MKPKVKFIKISKSKKGIQNYYLIPTNSKGEKIAFEVDGIK